VTRAGDIPFSFAGQRVLVTGAASGMGEAVARLAGQLGAEVHGLDLRKPSVPLAAWYEVDLREPAAIAEATRSVLGSGRVDRLFSCAGAPQTLPGLDVMAVNYLGLRLLAESLLPAMPPGAAITSVASAAGIGWERNLPMAAELVALREFEAGREWCARNMARIEPISPYAFSKQCVIVWTLASALPFAQAQRVRINCTAPGPTQTGMIPAILEAMGPRHFDRHPKPLTGELATPEEQAWPLLALASDLCSIVTGAVLVVDQGMGSGSVAEAVARAAARGAD
jgi:NAD(P)-dependent dehydrogenase (short-subunit alcohol dehydrogenase family)